MFWKQVLNEFLTKKKADNKNSYVALVPNIKTKILKSYDLGPNFVDIYFTKREAECMLLTLKGKTIKSIAASLKLSPRTVEFYIKNMKIKLSCHTKYELIQAIQRSDFIKNLDFDI